MVIKTKKQDGIRLKINIFVAFASKRIYTNHIVYNKEGIVWIRGKK